MITNHPVHRRELLSGAVAFATGYLLARHSAFAQDARGTVGALPQRGEFLIRNAHVLSMEQSLGDMAGADIHVRGGVILAVGHGLQAPGAEVIDASEMIAIPGLIDTHWHMWGSVARNMAGDDPKTGYYLFARAVGDVFTPEDNARGVRLSLAEAIHGGITTVHNWSHNLVKPEFADAELQAHRDFGGRALFGYGYAGIGVLNQIINLDDLPRVKRRWIDSSDGLLTLGICSRGPESNSLDLCRQEWEAARRLGLKISTHMGTSASRVKARQGVKVLADAGLLGPDVILVHDTNTSDEDIAAIAKSGAFVSMSPYTEMRTGFGIPPVLRMLDAGVTVCLSVDTTVLSGNADMFAIMKGIQNVADGSKPSEFAIAPRRVLEMATIGGARALGLADRIGSIRPGKRADIVLARAKDINMGPSNDAVRMIVQAAQPSNVDTVLIDGRVLKRGGRLVHIDPARLIDDAAETMARVRARVETMLANGEVSVAR